MTHTAITVAYALQLEVKNERELEMNVLLRISVVGRSVLKEIKTRCDLGVVCNI